MDKISVLEKIVKSIDEKLVRLYRERKVLNKKIKRCRGLLERQKKREDKRKENV